MRPVLLAAAVERKNPVHAKVCLKVQGPGFLAAKSAEAWVTLKRGKEDYQGKNPKGRREKADGMQQRRGCTPLPCTAQEHQ